CVDLLSGSNCLGPYYFTSVQRTITTLYVIVNSGLVRFDLGPFCLASHCPLPATLLPIISSVSRRKLAASTSFDQRGSFMTFLRQPSIVFYDLPLALRKRCRASSKQSGAS